LVRASLARSAALVVPSRFLLEVFASHGIRAAIIPNVVDVATFRPAEPPSARAPGAPHVVVARNLEHLYGNDLAIRALAQLRGRFPQARLTVAGTGPELGALQRLASDLGIADAVHFPGRLEVPGMVALYQSADVMVNPSRADNTPNSILEALACGVPVVSTSVGGVPFLVEHGRTAWLVKPDEPDLLADGIAQVLGDTELRRRLVGGGLSLVQACSWEAVRAQWLGLYRQLSGQRAPSAVH
jgi:glycosyltransferase involved in cell wall biosynthesis